MDNITAVIDMYILEIQLMNNGSLEEWIELGRSSSPPLQAIIPSRGLNSIYNLRGRWYNSSINDRALSIAYGPFVSYSVKDPPMVTDVAGHPVKPDTINVSWTMRGLTDCYNIVELSVNCGSIMVSGGEGTGQLITFLYRAILGRKGSEVFGGCQNCMSEVRTIIWNLNSECARLNSALHDLCHLSTSCAEAEPLDWPLVSMHLAGCSFAKHYCIILSMCHYFGV